MGKVMVHIDISGLLNALMWEEDGEDRTGMLPGGGTACSNYGTVICENLGSNPKSQAGSRQLLRREERLEDPALHLLCHSMAGVRSVTRIPERTATRCDDTFRRTIIVPVGVASIAFPMRFANTCRRSPPRPKIGTSLRYWRSTRTPAVVMRPAESFKTPSSTSDR
jgi:hypothetical protein